MMSTQSDIAVILSRLNEIEKKIDDFMEKQDKSDTRIIEVEKEQVRLKILFDRGSMLIGGLQIIISAVTVYLSTLFKR